MAELRCQAVSKFCPFLHGVHYSRTTTLTGQCWLASLQLGMKNLPGRTQKDRGVRVNDTGGPNADAPDDR